MTKTWGGAVVTAVTVVTIAVAATAAAPAAEAVGSVRSALTLTAPGSAAYGTKITLTGTLWRAGTRTKIPGARVYLQRTPHGSRVWRSVSSTLTSRTGTYAFPVTQSRGYDYRTYYAGSAVYTRALSPVRYPVVTQKVLLSQLRDGEPFGGSLTASGVRYPKTLGGPVYLQYYDRSANAWRNVAAGRTRADGRFDITGSLRGMTAYFRVYAPSYGGYGAGASGTRAHAHYALRGVFTRPVLQTGGTVGSVFDPLTPQEDPRRRVAIASANADGTAWGDVNVAGCKVLLYQARNRADGSGRVSILDGTTVLESTVLGQNGEIVQPTGPALGGRTRVRVQVSDIDSATGPYMVLRLDALCSN